MEEEGEGEEEEEEAGCFCDTDRHLLTNDISFEGVWIQCDDCSRWCHGECAGFDKVTAEAAETYSCPGCTAKPRQAPLSARQRPTHGCELVPSAQVGPASKAQGGRKRAKATAAARDAASNAAAAAPGTAVYAPVSAVSAPAGTPAVPTADAHAPRPAHACSQAFAAVRSGTCPPAKASLPQLRRASACAYAGRRTYAGDGRAGRLSGLQSGQVRHTA